MSLAASLSPRSHYLRVGVTGEILPVTVPPDCADLFAKRDPEHYDPSWCPFLRRVEEGTFLCTIYPARPGICRQFRCFTLSVTDASGKVVGRVVGRKTLESTDPALIHVWNEQVKGIQDSDLVVWREKAEKILKDAGFGVRSWED